MPGIGSKRWARRNARRAGRPVTVPINIGSRKWAKKNNQRKGRNARIKSVLRG